MSEWHEHWSSQHSGVSKVRSGRPVVVGSKQLDSEERVGNVYKKPLLYCLSNNHIVNLKLFDLKNQRAYICICVQRGIISY